MDASSPSIKPVSDSPSEPVTIEKQQTGGDTSGEGEAGEKKKNLKAGGVPQGRDDPKRAAVQDTIVIGKLPTRVGPKEIEVLFAPLKGLRQSDYHQEFQKGVRGGGKARGRSGMAFITFADASLAYVVKEKYTTMRNCGDATFKRRVNVIFCDKQTWQRGLNSVFGIEPEKKKDDSEPAVIEEPKDAPRRFRGVILQIKGKRMKGEQDEDTFLQSHPHETSWYDHESGQYMMTTSQGKSVPFEQTNNAGIKTDTLAIDNRWRIVSTCEDDPTAPPHSTLYEYHTGMWTVEWGHRSQILQAARENNSTVMLAGQAIGGGVPGKGESSWDNGAEDHSTKGKNNSWGGNHDNGKGSSWGGENSSKGGKSKNGHWGAYGGGSQEWGGYGGGNKGWGKQKGGFMKGGKALQNSHKGGGKGNSHSSASSSYDGGSYGDGQSYGSDGGGSYSSYPSRDGYSHSHGGYGAMGAMGAGAYNYPGAAAADSGYYDRQGYWRAANLPSTTVAGSMLASGYSSQMSQDSHASAMAGAQMAGMMAMAADAQMRAQLEMQQAQMYGAGMYGAGAGMYGAAGAMGFDMMGGHGGMGSASHGPGSSHHTVGMGASHHMVGMAGHGASSHSNASIFQQQSGIPSISISQQGPDRSGHNIMSLPSTSHDDELLADDAPPRGLPGGHGAISVPLAIHPNLGVSTGSNLPLPPTAESAPMAIHDALGRDDDDEDDMPPRPSTSKSTSKGAHSDRGHGSVGDRPTIPNIRAQSARGDEGEDEMVSAIDQN